MCVFYLWETDYSRSGFEEDRPWPKMLNYNVGILVLWNHVITDVMLMLAIMQEGAICLWALLEKAMLEEDCQLHSWQLWKQRTMASLRAVSFSGCGQGCLKTLLNQQTFRFWCSQSLSTVAKVVVDLFLLCVIITDAISVLLMIIWDF